MELQLVFTLLLLGLVSGDGDVTSGDQSTTPSIGFPNINNTIQFAGKGSNQLFYNISYEFYDNAVGIAQELVKNGDKFQVKDAVDSLINYSRSNVVAFAYKLWAAGEKKIVEDVFPPQFKMVYNDSLIKFSNNKYKIPIDYSRYEDNEGDKNLYGKDYEANSNNYIWKLEPVFDGKDVFFKIRHFSEPRYIKLGTTMDSDGELYYTDNRYKNLLFSKITQKPLHEIFIKLIN